MKLFIATKKFSRSKRGIGHRFGQYGSPALRGGPGMPKEPPRRAGLPVSRLAETMTEARKEEEDVDLYERK